MKFRLGELFCGPGGMAIAAATTRPISDENGQEFSIGHAWGVDKDPYAIETFKTNLGRIHPEIQGYACDVSEFLEKDLTEENRINALAFGFPCNSFSSVGKQKGLADETYGQLYKAGIRVIERYDVDWFIAENVSGIKSTKLPGNFKKILHDLAHAGQGYHVVAHLYRFEEYGVPQKRHRMVIVGIRSDLYAKGICFKVPAPTHGVGLKPFVTVREAFAKLASPQPAWGCEHTRQSANVVWRLLLTAPGKNAWDLEDLELLPDDALLAYVQSLPWYDRDMDVLGRTVRLSTEFHGDVSAIRDRISKVRLHVQHARMSHIYRRLEADKPSYTLTGSGGGGTHLYHWEEPRALTNCERAALQSFPTDFEFKGSKEQIRKQIGMAVPTQGARVIFDAILKTFARIPYKSVKPYANIPSKTEEMVQGELGVEI